MNDLPNRPLRAEEVAEYWSVTVRTVYLWIEHGHLQVVRKIKQDGEREPVRITRESALACRLGKRSES